MTQIAANIESCRTQFPALDRHVGGRPAVFLDGPAGTQVPHRVIDAIGDYLTKHNANHGGLFATSRESDQCLHQAHQAVAEFLNADDPDCVIFGPNMTSLTFALSRSIGNTWEPGDEVIVTQLDHDANVAPWVLAARDAGAAVRQVGLKHDCTLDQDDLQSKLSEKTKLVAVSCASNATGSIQPVRNICDWAHSVGALVFLDAVHFAPHSLIDVRALGCDFLACSAYKFFGPHMGILWGKRELLEELDAYKVRPAADSLPDKWMSGTQNHECIAGVSAAIDYLADLGRMVAKGDETDRRAALESAYDAIGNYERQLSRQFLEGMQHLDQFKVWGIDELDRLDQRVPTFSITHRQRSSTELAQQLANAGIFVWHGNYYALCLTEALGLEPDGMVRIGMVHYNTSAEVERLLTTLREIA